MQVAMIDRVTVRHDARPGDLGRVVEQHGRLYAVEYGFDRRFEAYVAEGVAEFGRAAPAARQRLWLAECNEKLLGSIAILDRGAGVAQLRWFLLDPSARGHGLGRRMVRESLDFCRAAGYHAVFLWTVSLLDAAAHLYREAGFILTEETVSAAWGPTVTEQRYDLLLAPAQQAASASTAEGSPPAHLTAQ
jgi:GNAT superfamily N-acetyltransferase